MGHSIEAYLGKRSTEELEAILEYCLNNHKKYGYVAAIVMKMLKKSRMESDAKK